MRARRPACASRCCRPRASAKPAPTAPPASSALVAAARARGLRIAGPNTDGVARFATGAVASIQPVLGQDIQPGPVAVVTQSGATAASLVRRLQLEGLGCGLYASTGNEADLGLEDYLSYALQDPEIRIVLSFVESIRRPADFQAVCDLAREVGKPIALIKVGRSEVGARRAAAHTGALAGADAVYDAVFRARGVIRVAELSELVAVAKLHLAIGAPASTGIGIISVSGGQAGALADVAATRGLQLPALQPAQEARLNALLTFGQGFNPCDVTGEIATNPALVGDLSDAFGTTPGIDTVVYARKELTGDVGMRAAAHWPRTGGAHPSRSTRSTAPSRGPRPRCTATRASPCSPRRTSSSRRSAPSPRGAGRVSAPAASGHPPRRVLDGTRDAGRARREAGPRDLRVRRHARGARAATATPPPPRPSASAIRSSSRRQRPHPAQDRGALRRARPAQRGGGAARLRRRDGRGVGASRRRRHRRRAGLPAGAAGRRGDRRCHRRPRLRADGDGRAGRHLHRGPPRRRTAARTGLGRRGARDDRLAEGTCDPGGRARPHRRPTSPRWPAP